MDTPAVVDVLKVDQSKFEVQQLSDRKFLIRLRGAKLFHPMGTDPEVARIMEYLHKDRDRVVITYKVREETWEEVGYIGCTTGPLKCPIMVYNERARGGSLIFSDAIFRIASSRLTPKRNGLDLNVTYHVEKTGVRRIFYEKE